MANMHLAVVVATLLPFVQTLQFTLTCREIGNANFKVHYEP